MTFFDGTAATDDCRSVEEPSASDASIEAALPVVSAGRSSLPESLPGAAVARMRLTRLGIIDLGSNTGRLILALRQVHGIPMVVDEAQVTLRLAEGLHTSGEIGAAAVERTRQALLAFRAAAARFGVERLTTVGTSALRDASNGAAVVDALQRETGLEITVLSGDQEAYYGYLSAVDSLPVRDGVVLDLGGGSLELSFVAGRACERTVSLPLGALRMNERFLTGDPPSSGEVSALRTHLAKQLRASGVRKLPEGQLLVGEGGTVRTLAKLVRNSAGAPSLRLHGYTVEVTALREITRTLLAQPILQRRRMAGLTSDRADIIGAGAVIVQAVAEATGAKSLLVCGQGLREGLAYEAFRAHKSPLVRDVRRAGIDAFRERYVTGALRQFTHEDTVAIAGEPGPSPLYPGGGGVHPSDGVEPLALRLLDKLGSVLPHVPRDRELLAAAAALCDAGRAISLYRWAEHAVYLMTNGDLIGYTRSEALLIGRLIAAQGGQRVDLQPYGAMVQDSDGSQAGRLGLVLGLARWLRRFGADETTPVSVLSPPGSLLVVLPPDFPVIQDEWQEGLARSCRRYFDRQLRIARVGD